MEQTVTLSQSQHFFELVNDSVMTRTMDGIINFWNRSAEELYGWRKEEAVGRVSHELLRTQFPKPLEEIESEVVRNGRWEGRLVHTTREGGHVVVESRWSLELEGQLGALVEINTPSNDPGTPTDGTVTEHKESQNLAELQQSAHLFELVNDSVMTRSMEGRISFWNRSAEELYGWRKEEAVGRVSHDLLRTQFPKPLEEIESELVRNGRWKGKLVHTTREGGRVVVESRWTLELAGQLGALVEINTRFADAEACTNTDSAEIGRQEPVPTNKMKADDLLPKVATIVLAGGAFLSIFVSLYFIYYYGWTAQRHFSTPFGTVLYVVFPAALAALLFGFLRRRPEFKVNLAIFCLSCAASLYGAEIFLHLLDLDQPKPIWLFLERASKEEKPKAAAKIAQEFGVKFDIRDRLEVIADLRKQGIEAIPAILPRSLLQRKQRKEIRESSDPPVLMHGGMQSVIDIHGEEMIPLGGVANKVTLVCNESGPWITYMSDEHGFNNPAGSWQSGQLDVAALGDSFTQGYCVPPDKSFVGLIRQAYPATLNLGMAANGPLYMLATLQEYLPFYRPKVVLWFYYEGNDLAELQIEKNSGLLMGYLRNGLTQGLLRRQNDIDQVLMDYIEREAAKKASQQAPTPDRVSKLLEIVKMSMLRNRLRLVYGETPEESVLSSEVQQGGGMDLFREVLSRAKADVSGWGGTLYFVYLPGWGRYGGEPEIGAGQRAQVLTSVKNLGIPVIDIYSAFEAQGDPMPFFPFRGPGHYNEKGHRVVGREIVKTISSNDFIRQKPQRGPLKD